MNRTDMGQNKQIFGVGIRYSGMDEQETMNQTSTGRITTKFPVNIQPKTHLNMTGNHYMKRKLSNHLNINTQMDTPMIIKNDVIEIHTLNPAADGISPKDQYKMNLKNSEINKELRYKYKLVGNTPQIALRGQLELESVSPDAFEKMIAQNMIEPK